MAQADSDLIAAVRSGHTDAFEQLYERYVRRIYDFVYFKTHHRETAEDLVSVTFLRAYERIDQFDDSRGEFSAWRHRIARNAVIDHYRSFKQNSSIDDAWDLSDDTDVELDADTRLKVQDVRAFLRTLKPEQRDVVLLRLWSGYSFAEIAEILGKTEAACKMSFKRTVEKVQAGLLASILLTFFS